MSKFAVLLTLFSSVSISFADGLAIQSFIVELISKYETSPEESAPDEIWSFVIDDGVYFYVSPMYCCDIPSTLYDSSGAVVCRPDGGIAGAGDGRCPDFFEKRGVGVLVWRDPRLKSPK